VLETLVLQEAELRSFRLSIQQSSSSKMYPFIECPRACILDIGLGEFVHI
jgi:hypothetical protein